MAKAKSKKRPQDNAITIRAPKDWLLWLDEAAEQLHDVPRTKVIDIALSDLATKLGIRQPPKRY